MKKRYPRLLNKIESFSPFIQYMLRRCYTRWFEYTTGNNVHTHTECSISWTKKKGLSIIATLIDSIYFVQSTYCVQSTGPALAHVILTTL